MLNHYPNMERPVLDVGGSGDAAVVRHRHGRLRRRKRNLAANKPNNAAHLWDSLERVHMTRAALRELDRRYELLPPPQASPTSLLRVSTLDRFARLGGPDLSHLLNFTDYELVSTSTNRQSLTPEADTMAGNRKTTNTRRACTPYDANFRSFLELRNIFTHVRAYKVPEDTRVPVNLKELQSMLAEERLEDADLKGEDCEKDFVFFCEAVANATSELEVLMNAIPLITGPVRKDLIPHKLNLRFDNLDSFTDQATSVPQPDWYDGKEGEAVNERVKSMIEHQIVPTKRMGNPICPNFFLECKTEKGDVGVLTNQACNDGTYGARGMEALRMVDPTQIRYDGRAYTISAVFHPELGLRMYTHHVRAPSAPGHHPLYVMYPLAHYEMSWSREIFVEGATALRNAREHCQKMRDEFTLLANESVAPAVGPGAAAGLSSPSVQLLRNIPPPSSESGHGLQGEEGSFSDLEMEE